VEKNLMLIELALIGGLTAYWLKRKNNTSTSSLTRSKAPKSVDSQKISGLKLLKDFKTAVFGDERQQLQLTIEPEMQKIIEKQHKEANLDLMFSASAIVFAWLSSVSPLFYMLAIVAILASGRNILRLLWRDLQKGHFFNVYILMLASFLGIMATGQLILAAFASILGDFTAKILEKTAESSQKQLTNVFAGHPSQVWIEKDGIEIQVDFQTIQVGDVVIVNAGEVIPVDGVIKSGFATIDQHILTGESQPVERAPGDQVFAATLLLSGRIRVLVETAGKETVAASIGHILNKTQNYKDNLVVRGKKMADSFVPAQLGLSVITLAALGPISATAVLWSSLATRMILYGPLSVLNYLQIFSRQGVLIKDGRILESLRQVDTFVFDKTGTLTLEQPLLGKIHPLGDYDEDTLLRYAAAAEYRQTHPIAKAIQEKALEKALVLPELQEANYEVGYGIKVKLENKTLCVGSARFMEREGIAFPETITEIQQRAEEVGHSLIYVGIDNHLGGVLEIEPRIRPEARQIIQYLKQRGLEVYIISGDHEQPTRNIAEQLGIDRYFAETLPEKKADLVKQWRDEGKFVCFVGDGINDAIALKSAQVSISLKGASTAATDTAQIIFMDGTLNSLLKLFQLADEFEDTMQDNFMLSIVPGVINIGGVYLLHFGIAISMTIFYAGTVVGLANTLWPLAKHQNTQKSLLNNTKRHHR
jgi:Cu2+-exporting ATPase